MVKRKQSSIKNINKKNLQFGGDGNHNAQSVQMPIQYFGGELNRYFPAGSKELIPAEGAYGPTVANSFGTYDKTLTCGPMKSTAPNLAPFPNSSGIQTGGKRKKSRRKIKQFGGDGNHNAQSVQMPIQYFGGELNRYFPAGSKELIPAEGAYGPTVAKSFGTYDKTLTCGPMRSTAPNLAPFPNSSGIQTGGKRKKSRRKIKQFGGDGNHNAQSVQMPIQYFGGELNRYFPDGSKELIPAEGAYGPTVAKSFGTYDKTLTCGPMRSTAPNLAPFPNSSGIQTGGKRKKSRRKIKQFGGDGNHNAQSVQMPIQYFGGELNRYFPDGSKELIPAEGAYGPTVAKSFGTYDKTLTCGPMRSTAPNLAPFPNSSGIQTGGKKKGDKN